MGRKHIVDDFNLAACGLENSIFTIPVKHTGLDVFKPLVKGFWGIVFPFFYFHIFNNRVRGIDESHF